MYYAPFDDWHRTDVAADHAAPTCAARHAGDGQPEYAHRSAAPQDFRATAGARLAGQTESDSFATPRRFWGLVLNCNLKNDESRCMTIQRRLEDLSFADEELMSSLFRALAPEIESG